VVGKKIGVIRERMSAYEAKVVGDPYSLVLYIMGKKKK